MNNICSEDRGRLSLSIMGGHLTVKYNFGMQYENLFRLIESVSSLANISFPPRKKNILEG